jgi:hypothetical protein
MISSLKKILKRKRNRVKLRQSSFPEYVTPSREWLLALGIATLAMCGGGALLVYDFYLQTRPMQTSGIELLETPRYRKNEVEQEVKKYREKEKTFTELRQKIVLPKPDIVSEATTVSTSTEPLAESGLSQ